MSSHPCRSLAEHWQTAEAFGPDFNGSPCMYLLKAPEREGYVRLQLTSGGKRGEAHRLMYEWMIGPIPPGLQLDHLCNNTGCVNPWHCEPKTGRANVLRGMAVSAIAARRERCIHNHEFSPAKPGGDRKRICKTCKRDERRRRTEREMEVRKS